MRNDLIEALGAIADGMRAAGEHEDAAILDRAAAALEAAREDAHPDDAAVDAFAVAMKAKLAAARAKGRGGWNGDEPGMQQRLSDMLRAHVDKGDPRDVANFAMFLHQRGEAILPRLAERECPHRTRCDCLAGCKWGFANGGAK